MQKTLSLGLTATLIVLLLARLSTITNEGSHVAAAVTKSTAPVRGYYLTNGTFDGSHALTACTTGYHMASLWEIHEPSNLNYQASLGLTSADSGNGPPTVDGGWVRTGFSANAIVNTPGLVNCNAWTSNLATDYGTLVFLDAQFYDPSSLSISPWIGNANICSTLRRVWCIQD